jgi:hypothetical protein
MRLYFLLFFLLPSILLSQRPVPVAATAVIPPLSGRTDAPLSLALEMQGYGTESRTAASSTGFAASMLPRVPESPYSRKSPFLAGILSVVVPGAGELYAGSYWLAGLFAALEGAGWYFNIRQNRLGDEETGVFEMYADSHWSVVKYAEWLNANAKDFPGGENAVHIDINPDESLPHWQRVNWEQMHATEMAVPVFSHKLPPHGDQQYFELIGKYEQYSYGWDDKTDGYYRIPSDNFLYYAGIRGEANDHYNTADTILNLIILNHVLSAIDAAWAAARFNAFAELYSSARLQRLPDGRADIVATAQFSVRF